MKDVVAPVPPALSISPPLSSLLCLSWPRSSCRLRLSFVRISFRFSARIEIYLPRIFFIIFPCKFLSEGSLSGVSNWIPQNVAPFTPNSSYRTKMTKYLYIYICFFKYRRYFNRRACLSVFCLYSVLQKKLEICLVIIVYTPVLSTTGSYWLSKKSKELFHF